MLGTQKLEQYKKVVGPGSYNPGFNNDATGYERETEETRSNWARTPVDFVAHAVVYQASLPTFEFNQAVRLATQSLPPAPAPQQHHALLARATAAAGSPWISQHTSTNFSISQSSV